MPTWTKEQSDAINFDHNNIIVSAGAGSGKTAVLTARVIRKLKEGIHINELLILTFTNAAAFEMKERIRKAIKKEPSLIGELQLIDEAYITTFDSYAMAIVKKYHYLLNVKPNITIIEDSIIQTQKELILDTIFEEQYQKEDPLFSKLINDFCIKDDSTIKKYILNIASKIALLSNKEEYLNTYLANYLNQEKIDNDIITFEKILLNKIQIIKDSLHDLSNYVDSDYLDELSLSLNNLLNSKNYDDIKNNLNIKMPNLPKNSSDEAKSIKEKISTTIKELKSLCPYEDITEIKESIISTKDYLEIIISILKQYFERLLAYKQSFDAYEFTDIATMAISLLKENKDVCEEIKNKLNEIMIDEYQDTNDLQEEFISYISKNNVYMVGDIKQSIYRFRNANPYIFKNKYDSYSNNQNGIKIDLNKNFRSRKEVLENINLIFNQVMDDFIGGANYLESHQMIFGNMTYVNEGNTNQSYNMDIYTYDYDKESPFTKEEIECFIIANDIEKKINDHYQIFDKDTLELRDITYSDFVILLDRSTSFDLFKKIFEYKHIPLATLKDEKLNTDQDMFIINNLLKFIIKIHHKEYDTEFKYLFISIMRSFIYGEEDNTIFNYFINKNFYESDLYQKANIISNEIDHLNSKEILTKIIDTFNIYEKLITIGNINKSIIKIDKLFDLANNLSDIGYDPCTFSIYLDDMIKNDYEIKYTQAQDDSNAVKIMTIHKSKGLEYHICYFANLYKSFNISDLKDKFMYDQTYGIICPYFDEGIGETIYKKLVKENYIKEEISEKIRLFYVALTRAKEKMIIVKPQNENFETSTINNSIKLSYRSFANLLDSISFYLKDYVKIIDLAKEGLTYDYNLSKKVNYTNLIDSNNDILEVTELNIDNQLLNSNSFSKKINKLITKEEKHNLETGLKVHEYLETSNLKDINANDTKTPYYKYLVNFLNQPLLSQIKDATIYKEYEFIYDDEDNEMHGIIDLMLVYQDHVDIIDYKLKNVQDENYLKQLSGYQKYITKVTNKVVNTYLYSIIDNHIEKIN